VAGGAAAFLAAALYVPALREVFRFARLSAADVALCLVVGLTSILWFELLKVINRKRSRARR
jgi:Ca2+-transporting ATPase